MQIRNPLRLAVAGVALAAAALFAQTGVVIVSTPGVNASFNVEVPDDAGSYQVTVYDHDGWWNPDDVLQTIPPADTTNPDGTKAKIINIQAQLSCVAGILCGGAGSSDESCAEVYCVVTWYPKSAKEVTDAAKDDAVEDIKPCGSTETEIQEVCCGG